MQNITKIATLLLVCVAFLSSCSSVPDHAKYIPKDASVVIGVNIKEIGKTLTWNAIMGSKVLDDMKKGSHSDTGKSMLDGIEKSGIDWMNTAYFFGKPDKRFSNDMKLEVVMPLSDRKDWEVYLKKLDPEVVINKVNNRSEAMLGHEFYAAWNDDVLLVMNNAQKEVKHEEATPAFDTTGLAASGMNMPAMPMPAYSWNEKVTDSAATIAEMEASFNIKKDASIVDNDRFKKLVKQNDDISVFVAYDAVINNMPTDNGMAKMMMSPGLWKNAAMTTSINFKDGKITGDMNYYPSDSLEKMFREAGKDNVDKDLLNRLPADKLNMAIAYHLSTEAIKMFLNQTGYVNLLNNELAPMGTNTDEILAALTGDMALTMNEFSFSKHATEPDSTMMAENGGMSMQPAMDYKPDAGFLLAVKIKDKAKTDKLITMLTSKNNITPVSPNTYQIPLGGQQTVTIVVGDKYIVASNKEDKINTFIAAGNGKMPAMVSKEIDGHPSGLYFDIRGMIGSVDPSIMAMAGGLADVKNLLLDFRMNGGEFKTDANVYHAEINFVDQKQNSLIQILQFVQRMSAKNNQGVDKV